MDRRRESRSTYGQQKQEKINGLLRSLIRSTLQEQASDDNLEVALDWCLNRFRDHLFKDTDKNEVERAFEDLAEKLRIHSRVEASEYVREQGQLVLSCPLSKEHTREPNHAVLRALLALSWQPTRVPTQVVRSLKSIGDGRRTRIHQRKIAAGITQCDRQALLELELKQVSQSALRDWDEAWDTPADLDYRWDAENVEPRNDFQSGEATDYICGSSQEPEQPLEWDNLPVNMFQKQGAKAWPSQLPPPCRVAAEEAEEELLEASMHMLAGHSSENEHSLAAIAHTSSTATKSLLEPLAVLGRTIERLRLISRGVQAVVPPVSCGPLAVACAKLAQEGPFTFDELLKCFACHLEHRETLAEAALLDLWEISMVDEEEAPPVFGLCWQSVMMALDEHLQALREEVQQWQTAQCLWLASQTSQGSKMAVEHSMLRLSLWLKPRRTTLQILNSIFEETLAAIGSRSVLTPPGYWAWLSGEELISRLSRALRGEELAGKAGSSYPVLFSLWQGATQPLLAQADRWGAVGDFFDPCSEFLVRSDLPRARVLATALPQAVYSSGIQVRLMLDRGAILKEQRAWRKNTLAKKSEVEDGEAGPFIPFEASASHCIYQPLCLRARATANCLLAGVLRDESEGLLAHISAVQFVAFLQRSDILEPLVTSLFSQAQSKRDEVDGHEGSLVVDLNAALMECLDIGNKTAKCSKSDGVSPSVTNEQMLCAKHLLLALSTDSGTFSKSPTSSDVSFHNLRLKYAAPPPLDFVLGPQVMQSYSSIMALLLNVKFAASMLRDIENLPIFRLSNRHRRQWLAEALGSGNQAVALESVARRSDLLRAELGHFLRCFEWYLQMDVIAPNVARLRKQIQALSRTLAKGDIFNDDEKSQDLNEERDEEDVGDRKEKSEGLACEEDLDMDLAAWAQDPLLALQRLHAEGMQRMLQQSFLIHELRTVLDDCQVLLSLATELRHCLVELVQTCLCKETDEGDAGSGTTVPPTPAPDIEREIGTANAAISRIHRDFRSGMRFFLQVLSYSVSRGTVQEVSRLRLHLNFNHFYSDDL